MMTNTPNSKNNLCILETSNSDIPQILVQVYYKSERISESERRTDGRFLPELHKLLVTLSRKLIIKPT
ncbi:MAG: hypothetical protein WBA20_12650, partial [Ketobacter sp.]